MHDHATADGRPVEAGLPPAEAATAGRGSVVLALIDRLLRRHGIGRLHLTLPSGAAALVGDPASPAQAQLVIRSHVALWRLARRGLLGFAEAYMDGLIETPDLKALFRVFLANEAAIQRAMPRLVTARRGDRRYHLSRANTRDGSRRNIADHYDLGNAFYRLWLDPSMLYSSAIWIDGTTTLEAAQHEKLARVLTALEMDESNTLLEIGSGWGALAEAAALRGARVRTITISGEQLAEARARIERAGLSDRVDVCFEDYRETRGEFDRIVSVEMIEAVGEENWPAYFRTLHDRLVPGGVAVLQAISMPEHLFADYQRNPDFIQRYIFPGGMLPTIDLMRRHAAEAGLGFETVERFGLSYALTLADWRRRFEAAWPEIAALGFDERFRRMWLYYLVYCEIGFERGMIDVGLYRLRRQA